MSQHTATYQQHIDELQARTREALQREGLEGHGSGGHRADLDDVPDGADLLLVGGVVVAPCHHATNRLEVRSHVRSLCAC